MKNRALFSLVTALFLLASVPASAQNIKRTFPASAGGTLDLRLEAGGSVSIQGGGSAVDVEILRSGRDADQVRITFDEAANGVVLTSEFDTNGRHDVDLTYRIKVPSAYNVDLQLTGGNVSIEGVTGTIDGQTMGGSLNLTRLGGKLDLQTMGGAINLTSSNVDGRLHTMGGAIELTNVQGDVATTTMGGNISFKNVSPRGETAMKVNTMGGDITVEDAPAGADVQTMGGDISVGQVGRYLKAETMGGDIDITGVDGWLEAKTMGGDVEARIVGGTSGDRHVDITSMGGNIDLTVPDGLPMEFDIEVTIEGRNRNPGDYVIESDFPMDVSTPQSRSSRMRLTARGSVAGGSNLIRIRTVNGNVRVLKGN